MAYLRIRMMQCIAARAGTNRMMQGIAARAAVSARRFQCGASSMRFVRAYSGLSGFPDAPPAGQSHHFANPQDPERSEAEVVRLVHELGTERKWQEALDLYSAVPEPSEQLRFNMLRAYTRSFRMAMAFNLFQELQVREVAAYNLMICMLRRQAKHIEQVRGLEQEMRAQNLQPNAITFKCMLAAYSYSGDAEAVVRLMSEMEAQGYPPSKEPLSCALVAYSKQGNHAKAKEMLARMDSMSFSPDSDDFTHLVSSYTQSQDEEGARAAFAEMRRRGVRPTTLAYTRMIGCLGGPEAFKKAEALLAEMRAEGVEPHLLCMKTVLRAATMSTDLADVRKVLEEMVRLGMLRDVGPLQDLTLESIDVHKVELREVLLSNDIRDLVRVLNQMLARGPAQQPWSAAAAPAAPTASATPFSAPSPLPTGWQEATDPSSGRSYYYRTADPNGSVTWQRPI